MTVNILNEKTAINSILFILCLVFKSNSLRLLFLNSLFLFFFLLLFKLIICFFYFFLFLFFTVLVPSFLVFIQLLFNVVLALVRLDHAADETLFHLKFALNHVGCGERAWTLQIGQLGLLFDCHRLQVCLDSRLLRQRVLSVIISLELLLRLFIGALLFAFIEIPKYNLYEKPDRQKTEQNRK